MNENPLLRCWRGEAGLARVFWFYGVAPSTVAVGLLGWAVSGDRIGNGVLAFAITALLAYTVWILVSVWRCASRRGVDSFYGVMARWLTVAWAINAVLLGGFLLLSLRA
jgi:hypothetical protein